MKKIVSLLLTCALTLAVFTGCDRRSVSEEPADGAQQVVNFAPETTAVTSEMQPIAQDSAPAEEAAEAQPAADDVAADEPVVQDAAIEEPVVTPEPVFADPASNPYLATPQPNAVVSSYSEVTNTGLGFRFSYPTGWNNIPGRSTVCYVQPLEEGTVYPARVAVTMKSFPHAVGEKTAKTEIVEYMKLLMSQYDERTFEVDEELNTSTKFMGNKDSMSTHYLAYDGAQEIKGYVIMTWFEKYLFCFHFLCAYEDYPAFEAAMIRMRDSVSPEEFNTSAD